MRAGSRLGTFPPCTSPKLEFQCHYRSNWKLPQYGRDSSHRTTFDANNLICITSFNKELALWCDSLGFLCKAPLEYSSVATIRTPVNSVLSKIGFMIEKRSIITRNHPRRKRRSVACCTSLATRFSIRCAITGAKNEKNRMMVTSRTHYLAWIPSSTSDGRDKKV